MSTTPGEVPLFTRIKGSKVKDALLFVGGLAGMVYEAAQANPRPILVGSYLLALGLGAFFPVDRLFQRPPPPDPPTPSSGDPNP